jgi:hypothetical protein
LDLATASTVTYNVFDQVFAFAMIFVSLIRSDWSGFVVD